MKSNLSLLVITLLLSNCLLAQNAPVTTIGSQYGCSPGTVTIPVNVSNFTNIGAFSLDLEYDPAVLTFIQGVRNPGLYGSFILGDNILPGGNHHIVISWFGPVSSLPGGSSLVDLKFTFLGGTTNLSWLDDGSSCEYADASYNPLADTPTGCYYRGGTVSAERLLTVNFLLQGLYNSATHRLNSAISSSPGPCAEQAADQVIIELHNASDFSTVEYASGSLVLDVTGHLDCLVPFAKSGNYYLALKHRNSIETVSALPVSFSGSMISYDFTVSASRAFGSNMTEVEPGTWALFAGDANQDGIVDSGDMIMVDNDVSSFNTGYIPSDCNGDGLTDSSDMIIIDNNSAAFVTAALP